MSLRIVPVTLKEANRLVALWHRHRLPTTGGLFAIAAANGPEIVGAVIVGMPISRHLSDGWTVEVNRLTTNGSRNACSLLYAAAWRAARAMGYRRMITYTLPNEGGASLRGAGWRVVAEVKSDTWNRPGRPRVELYPQQGKLRWEITA